MNDLSKLLFYVCSAYMSSPAHIELIAEEKSEEIVKEVEASAPKFSRKQLAQVCTCYTVTASSHL